MNGHSSPFVPGAPQIDSPAEYYSPGPSSQPFSNAASAYTLNSPVSEPHTLPGSVPGPSSASGPSVPSLILNFNAAAARGRGRGRGRGMSKGQGRGRGRGGGGGGGGGGVGRQSARTSTRPGHSGAPKLKISFKIGDGGGGGGRNVGFLGEYDRELDENPEEPLAFEEQFILRVPREIAEGRDGLREMIRAKKGLDGVDFKFLDPRRAAFRYHGATYAAKLVDLPCIVESQKTVDSRHLFKVADISQMLVVTDRVASESSITSSALRIDDYIWPHGITPPLRYARKRRFRKRLSRRAIEVVEEQVEELLKKDEDADEFAFDLIDSHPDPDIADSYYVDWSADDPYAGWHENGSEFGGSEAYEDPGSALPEDWEGGEFGEGDGEGEGEEGYDDEADGDDVLDEDLQAALMERMERSDESGSEEEWGSDDDDDDGARSEEDEETTEQKAKIKQYASEIKQLETLIEKKRAGFTGGNPIITKRFEETIAGLQADVNTKIAARQALIDELDKKQSDARAVAEADAQHGAANGKDGAAAGGTGVSTPFDGDVDMDAEGEYEGATPAGATPGGGGGTPMGESPAGYSEDEDLFGDGDESGTEDGGDKDAEGDEDGEGEVYEGEGDAEGEADDMEEGGGVGGVEVVGAGQVVEEDDEMDGMAALLEAELGKENLVEEGVVVDIASGVEAISTPVGTPGGTGALASPKENTFRGFTGIEGGVGMRRLASGVAPDDDDDDSGSSEDSD